MIIMKTVHLLPALTALCLAVACGSSTPVVHHNEVRKADVSSEETVEPGTLWVNASGYGKDEPAAIHDAEKAAFSHLLFQGIPGTQWNLPMVPNESVSKRDNAAFYTGFFDGKGYRDFVMSSTPGPLNKVGGADRLDTRIKVNVQALRMHLEKNNIIRKFGL